VNGLHGLAGMKAPRVADRKDRGATAMSVEVPAKEEVPAHAVQPGRKDLAGMIVPQDQKVPAGMPVQEDLVGMKVPQGREAPAATPVQEARAGMNVPQDQEAPDATIVLVDHPPPDRAMQRAGRPSHGRHRARTSALSARATP
jgi:hypothetical protein